MRNFTILTSDGKTWKSETQDDSDIMATAILNVGAIWAADPQGKMWRLSPSQSRCHPRAVSRLTTSRHRTSARYVLQPARWACSLGFRLSHGNPIRRSAAIR